VTLDCLRDHRQEVVLADVRFYLDGHAGTDGYAQGHIPGAVYIELREVLADPDQDNSRGRHPLPSPERFANGLAAAGIGEQDTVVAYDDAGGVMAARLVWMLRVIGHDAALLDGGLQAWPADELETGPPKPPRTDTKFTPTPWPQSRFVEIDDVASLDADTVLTDARPFERYAGTPDGVDPRAGHIPGAVSLSARDNLAADGLLLPRQALTQRFAQAGLTPGRAFISSCGSGVTACHNLLVHEQLGLGDAKLYVGSWSEWSRDPARPIATGS